MATNKVSYAKLNLKTNTDVNTFDFMDNKIEVLKYLPIEDKYDLIVSTLQQSEEEDGVFSEVKINLFFHLYMVYLYSNLSFTEKQRENPAKLYDALASNGFLDQFLAAMEESEYDELYTNLMDQVNAICEFRMSTGGVLSTLIKDLPANAKAAADIVNHFDPKNYQAVLDFAKAANGNRPI